MFIQLLRNESRNIIVYLVVLRVSFNQSYITEKNNVIFLGQKMDNLNLQEIIEISFMNKI